jgi:hypothetical protein
VGRALKQLGIGHIPAYSPEARGRCERAFRTLQDRLPKELALAGITSVEAANQFLREVYLPDHNGRFAVPADEPAAVFVAVPEALWRDVLCLQEERRVGNDNCVRWRGRSLQIPPTPLRPHLVRATVRVHEYPDGTLAIFKGPQRLVSFSPVNSRATYCGQNNPLATRRTRAGSSRLDTRRSRYRVLQGEVAVSAPRCLANARSSGKEAKLRTCQSRARASSEAVTTR